MRNCIPNYPSNLVHPYLSIQVAHYPFAGYGFEPPLLFSSELKEPQQKNVTTSLKDQGQLSSRISRRISQEKRPCELILDQSRKTLTCLKSKKADSKVETCVESPNLSTLHKESLTQREQEDKRRERQIAFMEKRNLQPSTLSHLFGYIQTQKKSGQITRRMFERTAHDPVCTVRRFYLYQKELNHYKSNMTNLRGLHHLGKFYDPGCERWSFEEQKFYQSISRVLIRHFFREYFVVVVASSSRIKPQTKGPHLEYSRRVNSMLQSILEREEI